MNETQKLSNETQKLSNPNNYKILIQHKFNRIKRCKTKYLTPELDFSKNENEALEFSDFTEAEKFLSAFLFSKTLNPKPRIIVKYKFTEGELSEKTQNQ